MNGDETGVADHSRSPRVLAEATPSFAYRLFNEACWAIYYICCSVRTLFADRVPPEAHEVIQDYIIAGLRGNPPPHRVAQRQVETWILQDAARRRSQRPVGAPIIPPRAPLPLPTLPSSLFPLPRRLRDGE